MTDSIYWLIFLLIALYGVSVWLKNKITHPLINPFINPTAITTVGVITYLLATDTPYQSFENAVSPIVFWLQAAVVGLAVPLYIQWQKIKSQWLAIIISQLVGSIVGIVSGVWLVKLFGGSTTSVLSASAKSVTMPIAIEVVKTVDGAMGITTFTVIVAGVVGQMVGLSFMYALKIRRPMSQSLAMGSASHALGIASITPMGNRYVAYGTVGLIMNGIMTAFFLPWIVPHIV